MNSVYPGFASSGAYKYAVLFISMTMAAVCHGFVTESPLVLAAVIALILLANFPFRCFTVISHLVYIFLMAHFNLVDARVFSTMLFIGVVILALAPMRLAMLPPVVVLYVPPTCHDPIRPSHLAARCPGTAAKCGHPCLPALGVLSDLFRSGYQPPSFSTDHFSKTAICERSVAASWIGSFRCSA